MFVAPRETRNLGRNTNIYQGYKTYATSRTDGEKLQQLKAAGAETATFDISSIESIVEFKRILGDQPVDLFINNAGKL